MRTALFQNFKRKMSEAAIERCSPEVDALSTPPKKSTPSEENLNDYATVLLKPTLENLRCIHIPGDVFQRSGAHLEPSLTSTMELFCQSKPSAILPKALHLRCFIRS